VGETGAKIRFAVEHVFATQKNKMKLCIRTIGTNKATVNMASPISLTTCSDTSFMSSKHQATAAASRLITVKIPSDWIA